MAEEQGSATTPENEHGGRKDLIGIVTSDHRDKTITVAVKRLVKHPRYGKFIYRTTKFHAHDEQNVARKGDRVSLRETRPISKQKRWRLIEVLERAADLSQMTVHEVEAALAARDQVQKTQTEPAPAAEAAR
jgi:small subunit ribosomal protein S17